MEEVKKDEVQVNDIEKLFAFLSYMLFFGVLIYRTKKDSEYVQFHAKQGMLLFGISLANFILMAIPFLGWILIPILNVSCLVLFVMGANNALCGNKKMLPLIGALESVIK